MFASRIGLDQGNRTVGRFVMAASKNRLSNASIEAGSFTSLTL